VHTIINNGFPVTLSCTSFAILPPPHSIQSRGTISTDCSSRVALISCSPLSAIAQTANASAFFAVCTSTGSQICVCECLAHSLQNCQYFYVSKSCVYAALLSSCGLFGCRSVSSELSVCVCLCVLCDIQYACVCDVYMYAMNIVRCTDLHISDT